jgi:hypothetical protein
VGGAEGPLSAVAAIRERSDAADREQAAGDAERDRRPVDAVAVVGDGGRAGRGDGRALVAVDFAADCSLTGASSRGWT